ncbi:DUF3221 domain-containing protein [Pontibacter sp. H249]|uniref:DUF3221 domain-containing protein n=1 Tax=Pontibacter sp. H249 TaxID=3133420 RepID=UPI0030C4E431
MKNPVLQILVVLMLCTMASCRGDEPKRIPTTLPDVRGYISHIKKTSEQGDKSKAIILVKAIEGIEAKHQNADIIIDKNTLIESETGEHLKLEQLREGQEVQAWLEGDVMETDPVQGYAKAVRVSLN